MPENPRGATVETKGSRCGVFMVRRRRSGRVACSGRARSVLDHIEKYEQGERPLRRCSLPISGTDNIGEIVLPYPLDAEEWDRMMTLLDLMKPALVKAPRV